MDRNNEKLYLCDPNKNIECKKTDCGHLGTGKCFCTTNKDYMVEGYLIEVKTNQDKIAEMVRTMDANELALLITNGIERCQKCPAEKYCDQHTCIGEEDCSRVPDENGELLDCNQIFERWLKEVES